MNGKVESEPIKIGMMEAGFFKKYGRIFFLYRGCAYPVKDGKIRKKAEEIPFENETVQTISPLELKEHGVDLEKNSLEELWES